MGASGRAKRRTERRSRKADEGAGCSAGVAADDVGGEPFGVCGVYGVLTVQVLRQGLLCSLFVLVPRSISYLLLFPASVLKWMITATK
jgi:hypothetical protein